MSNAITRQSTDPRLLFPFLVLSALSALHSKEGTWQRDTLHTHNGVNVTACSGDLSHPRMASLGAPGHMLRLLLLGCARVGAGKWNQDL